MSLSRKVAAVVLFLTMTLGGAILAMARDRNDKCENKIHKAEQKLQRDEQKHGRNSSRKIEKDRQELEQARARCDMNGHHEHDRDHDRH